MCLIIVLILLSLPLFECMSKAMSFGSDDNVYDNYSQHKWLHAMTLTWEYNGLHNNLSDSHYR